MKGATFAIRIVLKANGKLAGWLRTNWRGPPRLCRENAPARLRKIGDPLKPSFQQYRPRTDI